MLTRTELTVFPERYPLACQWEITCRCNLRCVMCYTDCFNTLDKLQQELSFPEILRIMDEIHEAGCLELCLTGGEPLVRKDFGDIYAYAKQKGFLVYPIDVRNTLEEILSREPAFRKYLIKASLRETILTGLRSRGLNNWAVYLDLPRALASFDVSRS